MLPLVVTVEHGTQKSVRRFAFADSPIRIGRSPFAELQLTESFISRWEGTLRFDDQGVTYFNLSSTNPTFVNGRQAEPNEEIAVSPDTVIALGELTLRFVRMPVPESDLRRKGKRRPVAESPELGSKTQWLGAAQGSDAKQAGSLGAKTQWLSAIRPDDKRPVSESPTAVRTQWLGPQDVPRAPVERAERHPSEPVRVAPPSQPPQPAVPRSAPPSEPIRTAGGGVIASAPIRVLGQTAVGATPASPSSLPPARPERPMSQPSPSEAAHSPSAHGFAPGSGTHSTSSMPPGAAQGLDALHGQYRAHWDALLRELTKTLEHAPAADRPALADQLQRRFPQITLEPDFRALLKRLGLDARRADIPEIGEWLSSVAEGILPANIRLDTGLTLERILGLIEMLTESFAEVNDAQDSVRKRWLGRAPRGSVLQSDNGRVILAYLLNPKADWSERVQEVEDALSNVVMHELALFKATLEGARALLETLSPEAIAQGAQIDLTEVEESSEPGFWQRLKSRDDPRTVLWTKFVETYESLKDGARYQRVFMGRPFARTYLMAMGQSEAGEAASSASRRDVGTSTE